MSLKICFGNQVNKLGKTPDSYKTLVETINFILEGKLPKRYTLQYVDSEGDTLMLSNERDFRILVDDELKTASKAIKIQILPLEDIAEESVPVNTTTQQETIETNAKTEEEKKAELNTMIADLISKQFSAIAASLANNPALLKEQQPSQAAALKPAHNRIVCNGCGVHPIRGARYVCCICPDFDYCETCEATLDHPHVFMKLKTPDQRPPFDFQKHIQQAQELRRQKEEKAQLEKNAGSLNNGMDEQRLFEDLFRVYSELPQETQERVKETYRLYSLGNNQDQGQLCEQLRMIYFGLSQNKQEQLKQAYLNLPQAFRTTISNNFQGLPEKILNAQQTNAPSAVIIEKEEIIIEKSQPQESKQGEKQYSVEVKEKALLLKNIFEAGPELRELLKLASQKRDMQLEDLVANYLSH